MAIQIDLKALGKPPRALTLDEAISLGALLRSKLMTDPSGKTFLVNGEVQGENYVLQQGDQVQITTNNEGANL